MIRQALAGRGKEGLSMLFMTMFRISDKRMKRSHVLLFLTLVFCVAAMTVALLMVRSQKLQYMDRLLEEFGNYDIAFCDVTKETEQQIVQDQRFEELG